MRTNYTADSMMRDDLPRHLPVLHTTALELLSPRPGECVLDVTLGLAGHASAFAHAIGEKGMLIGLDADAENLALAADVLSSWKGTLRLHHTNFGALPELDLPRVDILFADLGLSSPHLDIPERGFTFRFDAPLDMRLDRSGGETASDLIERSSPEELMYFFNEYGELHPSQKLAHALAGKRWERTTDLRRIVEEIYGFRAKGVLPQVFQALRIAVNREMDALRTLLDYGPSLLAPGGRMGIISFHSLEDRMVKRAFRDLAEPEKDPLTGRVIREAPFQVLTSKPVVPDDAEIVLNPRARSAKFRVIRRSS